MNALVTNANRLIGENVKSMRVKGISGVDTLLSVYNEDGIKGACQVGFNKVYTVELCLPLIYLDLSAADEAKFAYHIILNGYKRAPTFGNFTNMDGTPATGPGAERFMAFVAQMDAAWSARTDFWGEYTLAKKP